MYEHQCLNMIYMPPADSGYFSIPVEANPFGDSCEVKLVEIADRLVAFAKEKATKEAALKNLPKTNVGADFISKPG